MKHGDVRLSDYLEHIDQAIRRIGDYLGETRKEQFFESDLLQDAVIRNLEIIGEASRNILRDHPEFADTHSGLPLRSAYEMRNVLAHGYFEVDLDVVWQTIVRDLPALAEQVTEIQARNAND